MLYFQNEEQVLAMARATGYDLGSKTPQRGYIALVLRHPKANGVTIHFSTDPSLVSRKELRVYVWGSSPTDFHRPAAPPFNNSMYGLIPSTDNALWDFLQQVIDNVFKDSGRPTPTR
ncbi:hypothetical protein KW782_00070 [Candidatus Parcubacteria bacterium]|nr:hypothetical protein [Candidatus Parcubacteria bacterium]